MLKFALILLALGCASADLPLVKIEGPVHDDSAAKIIKGENANEGEFPFIVSLRRTAKSPGHSCGGSILTSNWVLTAAHCCGEIKRLEDFYIYSGSIYLSRGGTKHTIQSFIKHENFQQAQNFRNDICLIRVSQPFKFGGLVQQVTLARENTPCGSGDKVTTAGWGLTNPNGSTPPDRLQKGVDFSALSQEECGRLTQLNMFPGYLCVKGKLAGQTVWKGDSGGPLVKQGAQVGLTSFGFFPYGNNLPTVFCRVTNYIGWIKQKLGADASQLKFK